MYKSLLSLALSGLLFGQGAAAAPFAPPQSVKEARRAEKARQRGKEYTPPAAVAAPTPAPVAEMPAKKQNFGGR